MSTATAKKTTKVVKANKVSNGKKATAKVVSMKPKFVLPADRTKKAKQLISKLPTGELEKGPGLITQILHLYTNDFACREIIAYGFNKSTVYRQTRELDKLRTLKGKKQVTDKAVKALKGTS